MNKHLLSTVKLICSHTKVYQQHRNITNAVFHRNRTLGFTNVSMQSKPYYRFISTIETKTSGGIFSRILDKMDIFNLTKFRTQIAAQLLYESVIENIDFIEFCEKYNLPDTFYSWFVIIELHLWLLSARGMAEGNSGKQLRNHLFAIFWHDVTSRTKKLGAANPAQVKTQLNTLSEQSQAALIAYDEGLLDSDMVLAGAIWRRLYQMQEVDPSYIEDLVKYIRIQMRILDNMPAEKLFSKTTAEWKPVKVT